jgi:hypothetical protein
VRGLGETVEKQMVENHHLLRNGGRTHRYIVKEISSTLIKIGSSLAMRAIDSQTYPNQS